MTAKRDIGNSMFERFLYSNNLGVVYQKKRQLRRAKELFEESLLQDPAYVKARLNLAIVLSALKQDEDARAHLENIVQTQGKSPVGQGRREAPR